MQPWLAWNSLCRPGWPQTPRDTSTSAVIKGTCFGALLILICLLGFVVVALRLNNLTIGSVL